MTRIDFYINALNKFDVMRKLAAKAVAAEQYILINVASQQQSKDIDRLLWTAQSLSFLPHVASDHVLANETPILIGQEPDALARPDIVINLANVIPDWFARFGRLLDIVSQESDDKDSARQRFRFLKDKGYEITVHDLLAAK